MVTAVSKTYSCCTMLSSQLGRAYNVHGNVRTVVCGHNERRDAEALYLKAYIDQFIEAGVKAENITMTLQYLNADGTMLYEGAYTYADLAAAVKPAA